MSAFAVYSGALHPSSRYAVGDFVSTAALSKIAAAHACVANS